jgi:predicted nucleic acid-binding Zn ribbon protein
MNHPMLPRPPRRIPPLGPPKATRRQRTLAAWRGIDLTQFEQDRAARAKSLGSVMPNVLEKLGLERRLAETTILKAWNQLIDPNIVAHAQPTGLRKGTLFVTVDSSVWLDEIVRYRRREILERLQHSFGRDLIQKISFRVG